jgi:hypothetical protein
LGDFFLPDPEIVCPLCGQPIREWDGFGGPGAFLVYRQGQADPVERRLESQVDAGAVHLVDGTITLFGSCKAQHSTMAEAVVEGGVWTTFAVVDVEAADPLPLTGPWFLWRASGGRFAVSTRTPTAAQGVVPTPITAVGFDDRCILAERDGASFVVDVSAGEVVGPLDEAERRRTLAERQLTEPAVLSLPDDV